jgi:hypothetical protein
METFKTKAIIKKNHKIELENVPFANGYEVEIEVTLKEKNSNNNYPLSGILLKYDEPVEPVAEDDWEILK